MTMHKKRCSHYFGIIFILVLALFAQSNKVNADAVNLIQNSSFENAGSGGNPASWIKQNWGSQKPTFKYPDVGRLVTGKSASITYLRNSTGDARWSHDPVSVSAGEIYLYSSWYKSTAVTEIDIEYTDSTGKLSYEYVKTLPSTANVWKQVTANITIPVGKNKIRVYHAISKKGTLTVDDFSLINTSLVPPPPPPAPMPTLEFLNLPQTILLGQSSELSWVSSSTTSCNASGGWTGSKSLVGSESVSPHATTTYILTCSGLGGSVVKQVELAVILPVSTTTEPGTWSEGAVTFTFDDAWISQYSVVLPMLELAGIKGTFYITTEPIIGGWSDFMTSQQVREISDMNHEIAGHTITHPHLTQLTTIDVNTELVNSKSYLENLTGKTVQSFAYPYGESNLSVRNLTSLAGYSTGRGVDYDKLNASTTDKFNLYSNCILRDTSIASIKKAIDDAKNNKQLYVICIHEVKVNGDQYSITPERLQEIIDYVKLTGIKTMTVKEAAKLLFNL